MPECENCGSHVSAEYQRVLGVDGAVRVCPWCPDKIRRGGKIEDPRSQRRAERE